MQPRRKPSGSRFTNLPPTPENTGALSNDTGRLDVGWGTEGETFTMSWTQRDGPPASSPQRRGFGTIVMQEMAERSVNGRLELGYAPCGMTWRLACPATAALEPGSYLHSVAGAP
jgi:two-component sensor histidine kinase